MKVFQAVLFSVLLSSVFIYPAFGYESHSINYKGKEQIVHYDLYLPENSSADKLPVLVCVGGLPIIDGAYVHSDPTECTGEPWERFAQEQGMAILGLGFLFDEAQWKEEASYQFPSAWSGMALKEILKKLEKDNAIDPNNLYMFGISAGAQFCVRYAFYQPSAVKAVAAHAAGGYDKPQEKINAKILITVGSQDNEAVSRVDWANFFVSHAKELGMDVRLDLIDGIGHRQTEFQNELSRDHFRQVLKGGR